MIIEETKKVDDEQFALVCVWKRTLPDGEDLQGWMKMKNLKRNPTKRDQRLNRKVSTSVAISTPMIQKLDSEREKMEQRDQSKISGGSCEDSSSSSDSDAEAEIAIAPTIPASYSPKRV